MQKLIEGVVLEVSGEIAKVKINRHSECSNCGACPGDSAMVLEVTDTIGVKAGQRVQIESKETNMLFAAFVIYLFPLIDIGIGIYLGYVLSNIFSLSKALMMTIGGALLGLISILIIKRLDMTLQAEKPIIIKVIK